MPHIDPGMLDEVLETLAGKASSDGVREKLRNLHAACRALIVDENVRPTVAGVVARYEGMFGARMAESSIRNKRDDKNPYNALYVAWDRYARARGATRNRAGEIVSRDELASIRDHDLRHRVALTMADNHHLRSRVNILEAANKERTIVVEGLNPKGAALPPPPAGVPNRHDLEEIRDFLAQLRERGLVKRADRAMATGDGRLLADPGFLDALERIAAVGK